MLNNTFSGPKVDLGQMIPVLQEKRSLIGGIQRVVNIPLGPPLLVNGTTYQATIFIAPCDGCFIKELWLAATTKITGGTNTLAVENYDKSASTGLNALSTTNIDPTTLTSKNGLQLTLSTTQSNLVMDEGDVLNATLVCGTMGTAGQGHMIQAVIWVPDLL